MPTSNVLNIKKIKFVFFFSSALCIQSVTAIKLINIQILQRSAGQKMQNRMKIKFKIYTTIPYNVNKHTVDGGEL